MATTTEKCISAAEDVAKRLNTQVLIIGASLILGALAIQGNYDVVVENIKKLVILEAKHDAILNTEFKTAHAPYKQIPYFPKFGDSIMAFDRPTVDRRCLEDNRPISGCREIRRAAKQVAHRKLNLSLMSVKRDKTDKYIIEQIRKITTILAEKVPFDLGAGLKLPFSFTLAPLVWLMINTMLWVFITFRRAQFWMLISKASERATPRESVTSRSHFPLINIPFWLAPTPVSASDKVLTEHLARKLGWETGHVWRRRLMLGLALLTCLVSGYIAWVGMHIASLYMYASALQREYDPHSTQIVPPGTEIIIALALALNIAAIIWWLSPMQASSGRQLPVLDTALRRRSFVLIAGAAGLSTILTASSEWLIQNSRRKEYSAFLERITKTRKRRAPYADLSNSQLTEGWYQNKKSKKIHYLTYRKHIPWARGIKPINLTSHQPLPPNAPVPAHSSHEYTEQAAINLVLAGEHLDAFVLIASKALATMSPPNSARPTQATYRAMDLAAGIAIRYDLGSELTGFVSTMESLVLMFNGNNIPPAMEARIKRWFGQEGTAWRASRWRCQPHPLRWNGNRYHV